MRENRTKSCYLRSVKDLRKSNRGAYAYRFDTNNELMVVRWKDNGVCTTGTNFDKIEPMGKVKRWCSQNKQKMDVNIPHLFQNYNKGMGGVDEMDGSISLYRVGIRGKKWWWVIFTYMIDMSISNAWRLHALVGTNKFDQLDFSKHIARSYLKCRENTKTRPSGSIVPGPNGNNGHNTGKLPKQL
ncbi:piggyBac transposable element-derived protein 2-like, partial [Bactrocera tryoni]|uniref:piggyBac transposable element-derived protein 2-like n=1 Tax=Bactrocera tryoni TaxID=59916 RepID=UPI001A961553